MKTTYRILNKKGAFLCYQVAESAESAVIAARDYYGFSRDLKRAHSAEKA